MCFFKDEKQLTFNLNCYVIITELTNKKIDKSATGFGF